MKVIENYSYMYDQYYNDVASLKERYDKYPDPHVVAIYRGSLPIATHLSNALNCPMSIIKYQSRDGESDRAEWILNLTHDISIRKHKQFFPFLILIDDIYDTGKTFRACLELDEFQGNPNFQAIALFGNENDDGVDYLNEQLYRWIVFPWERTKGGL